MRNLIYVYTSVRLGVKLVKKVKVTLSLREDLVKRAKSRLALESRSLSDLVEEFLAVYDTLELLDQLCELLGLEKRFYTSSEVKAGRPLGLKAEDVVRELRDERAERISGY